MGRKANLKLWRVDFREGVFARDNSKCRWNDCGRTDDLVAHHITDRDEMPNDGYVLSNGITVCPDCHIELERFHVVKMKILDGSAEHIENDFKVLDEVMKSAGIHPFNVYEWIGSSHARAVEDSRDLK